VLFYGLKNALTYWDSNRFCRVLAEDSDRNGAKHFHEVNTVEERALCFGALRDMGGGTAAVEIRPEQDSHVHTPLLPPPPLPGAPAYSSFYELIHMAHVYLSFDIDASAKPL
jgi:hypothetical protein